jgi:hypothetical protein
MRLPAAAPKANGDAGEAGEPNAKPPAGVLPAAAVSGLAAPNVKAPAGVLPAAASGLGAADAPNVKPPAGAVAAVASGLGAADAPNAKPPAGAVAAVASGFSTAAEPNVKPTFGAVLIVDVSGLGAAPAPSEKAPVEVAAPVLLSAIGVVAEELTVLGTARFVAAAPKANGAAAGAVPGASALAMLPPAAPNWKVGVVLAFALSARRPCNSCSLQEQVSLTLIMRGRTKASITVCPRSRRYKRSCLTTQCDCGRCNGYINAISTSYMSGWNPDFLT